MLESMHGEVPRMGPVGWKLSFEIKVNYRKSKIVSFIARLCLYTESSIVNKSMGSKLTLLFTG